MVSNKNKLFHGVCITDTFAVASIYLKMSILSIVVNRGTTPRDIFVGFGKVVGDQCDGWTCAFSSSQT